MLLSVLVEGAACGYMRQEVEVAAVAQHKGANCRWAAVFVMQQRVTFVFQHGCWVCGDAWLAG